MKHPFKYTTLFKLEFFVQHNKREERYFGAIFLHVVFIGNAFDVRKRLIFKLLLYASIYM